MMGLLTFVAVAPLVSGVGGILIVAVAVLLVLMIIGAALTLTNKR